MALISVKNKFSLFHQVRTLMSKIRFTKKNIDQILDDNFNFTSTLSLSSPNGQIENIYKKNEVYHVSLYHHGLTGAAGALPTAYTEWLIERKSRYNDHSAKAFLDIFNHRQYCLAYLAWQKQCYSARLEGDEDSTISNVVLSLCGMLQTPNRLPSKGYAQFYSYPVRSLTNLERILRQYCQTPVIISPFSGRWKDVDLTEQCQLGNRNITLGYGPVIGNVRWDIASSFDVIIGPVDLMTARYFMSGGKYHEFIQTQIRSYVGMTLDFKIKINLSTQENMPIGKGELGLNIRIGTQDLSSDYILRIQ